VAIDGSDPVEWGRAHADDYRPLRLADAATAIQTAWRAHTARKVWGARRSRA
jgi:hypothetical protein